VPEGPAVAGVETLRQCAGAMDRADHVAERDRAVGPHQRRVPASRIDELLSGGHETALEERRERHARRLTRRDERRERCGRQLLDRRDAFACRARIAFVALDPDEAAAEALCDRPAGAAAEK